MELREQLKRALGTAYTVDREIGGAGMSRVFVAEDTRLRRKVVVKVLDPSLAGSVSVERFTREIALAATLQHPCIVPLLSAGDMDGVPYYTMPLVEGLSLRQRLRDGKLSHVEAMKVLRDVASALDAAHRRGVVHRDVKPENVLLSGDYAMVTDFGIAKALVIAAAVETGGSAGGDEQITERGVALGTPAYMAPEQVAGEEKIDQRSDIYSWGVLAYEVLCGEAPFAGRSGQALLAAHVVERPQALAGRVQIVAPLATLVMRALEKDPALRPQSAGDLVAALDTIRAAPSMGNQTNDNSIAVLPFVNMSNDPETDYFSDGVTDEIIGTLARVTGLRVIGRASSFALKGKALDLKTIGERLGVARVVEGSVRRVGNRVRISAELVDVSDGFQRWSDRFDHDVADVFAVQDEIAHSIARALNLTSGASAPSSVQGVRRPVDPEAYELYLKGMYEHRNRGLVHGRMMKAVEYLEGSAALDPTFAPVHGALGSALYSLSVYSVKRAADVAPKALSHARRAIALDPADAAAHAAFGHIAFNYEWDWETALVHIDRALSLAPNDSFVLNRAAFFHLGLGRLGFSFTLAERSLSADPISPYAHLYAALVLVIGGNAQRAIEVAEAGCRINPGHVDLLRLLGLAYTYAGRPDDAVRVLDEAVANSNRQSTVVSHLAVARARHGDVDRANVLLDELLRREKTEIVHPRAIGFVLMELRRIDEAFVWFERAFEGRDWAMAMWGVDRRFDPIRGDARWEQMRQRIGIPS